VRISGMNRVSSFATVPAVTGGVLLLALVSACTGEQPPAQSGPTSIESTAPLSPTTDADDVGALLARPLALPSVAPGHRCPVTPAQDHSPVAQPADARGPGPGPLYPITFYLGEDATLHLEDTPRGQDGLYALKVVWASTPGKYEGPVIVRVDRTDGVGRGYVDLTYEPDASRGSAVLFVVGDTAADWPAFTHVSGPGCYAYQLDGRTFTQAIIFRVTE
jgi:hypothetical protein